MPQLVRVDDRSDHLHGAVGDLQAEDVRQAAVRVEDERARLAVDLDLADLQAHLTHLLPESEQQPDHVVPTRDGAPPRGSVSAAVPVHEHVTRQQAHQVVHVPVAQRREEPVGQLLPLGPGGVEPGLALRDVTPRPDDELAAVGLAPGDDLGYLVEFVGEDVPQQEDSALDG